MGNEINSCRYCGSRFIGKRNICPVCNKWLVDTEVEKKKEDMAAIPRSWRCKTCKQIFDKPPKEVSNYDANSFVRMTVCPYCKMPRQVYPIVTRRKAE